MSGTVKGTWMKISGAWAWARRARLGRRLTAWVALYGLLLQSAMAVPLRAETAGATAPEVTKWEPVDTTDLVNLATGDFTYNIPILNVPGPEGGYPLSLNYHAGLQHGEEASWVGLGWNLQPGSIARSVRGYPDDFYNVGIQKQFGSSSVYEYSIGLTNLKSGTSFGVSYNTNKGLGGYVSYGWQMGSGGNIGATYTYYGDGDWSIGVGFTAKNGMGAGVTYGSSGAIGIGVHGDVGGGSSRTRLGLSVTTDAHGSTTVGVSAAMSQGITLGWNSAGSVNIGSKVAGASASVSLYSGDGVQQEDTRISIPLGYTGWSLDLGYSEFWIEKTEYEFAYGYFNHHLQNANSSRVNEWILESDPKAIPGDDPQKLLGTGFHYLPSQDGYLVMGQGTGGALRPTRLQDWVYHPKRVDDKWNEAMEWPWPDVNGFGQQGHKARFVFVGDNTEIIPADSLNLNRLGVTSRGADEQGYLRARVPQLEDPSRDIDNPLSLDIQSVLAANGVGKLKIATFNTVPASSLFLGKSYRSSGGSRIVNPLIGQDGYTFFGFDIWELDGKRYLYREPVFNQWSENVAGDHFDRSSDWFRSRATIQKGFAYAWYLNELRYPDYLDNSTLDNSAMRGLSDDDLGGWVKFSYLTAAQDYRWHSSSDGEFNDGPINRVREVGQKKAGMMYGMEYGAKQLKYPLFVETATHKAFFSTSPRRDGAEVSYTSKIFDDNFAFWTQHTSSPRSRLVSINKLSNNEFEMVFDDYTRVPWINPESTDPKPHVFFPILASLGINIDILHDLPRLPYPWITAGYTNTRIPIAYMDDKTGPIPIQINGLSIQASRVDVRPVCVFAPRQGDGTATCPVRVRFLLSDQYWQREDIQALLPTVFSELREKWESLLLTAGQNNGQVAVNPPLMQKLDDIYLIEKSTNRLVKQVHFDYDYSLCQGTPNSSAPPTSSRTTTGGKLTLKSVQVFGMDGMGASATMKLPPYRFFYGNNPDYGSKYAHDRWGFHKSNGAMWQHRDPVPEDQDAWCLSRIQVPTGGNLYIQYEPKDYARVQDRRPQNAAANKGMVGNYEVDLPGWLQRVGLTAWPKTREEWDLFLAKVGTTPFESFAPGGDTDTAGAAVPKVGTTLPQAYAPWDSAPVPRDLVQWWSRNEAFTSRRTDAAVKMGISTTESSAPARAMMPPLAAQSSSLPSAEDVTRNTRLVNLVFEWFTAGTSGLAVHRRLGRPLDEFRTGELEGRTEEDRRTVETFSVLALMTTDKTTNRTRTVVIDPEFRWPRKAPNALYLTWTHPSAKVGGGVRVKRIVSNDGRRSYTTSYSYRDVVDGEWTTSGVAVLEPPPYGYSSDDDRIIYPEFGGWAHEGGGGIVHSRVVVRHAWSEDPTPAGVTVSGSRVETPGGESVFRFISPADLPHKVSSAGLADIDAGGNTRRVKVTEIFNMGAWWGQLLWREDRDSVGRPIQRVENRYTQLDGYLRYFPRTRTSDGAPIGTDTDVEYQFLANNGSDPIRGDRTYDWAEKYTNPGDRPLPNLAYGPADEDPAKGIKADKVSDQAFPNASKDSSRGYLNASLNVTLAYRTDYASQSSVELVRELNLNPLVSETRTYLEGSAAPAKVQRNTVWEARTGQVLETRSKGRTSPSGTPVNPNEWVISRAWPAYWAYPGMFSRDDSQAGYGMPLSNAEGFASGVVNMLSQTTQSTTSRLVPGATAENYLNSKIETWWQAPGGSSRRWLKGGDFVWNGSGAVPPAFAGYPGQDNWTPAMVLDQVGGYQPYKASGWLFAGAVTKYDAYGHALEAVEGDGIFGCSKYGYHATAGFAGLLPAGLLPVAKFANARDGETLYLNFEDALTLPNGSTIPRGKQDNPSEDPLVRLAKAYSGEQSRSEPLAVPVPTSANPSVTHFELRYFVKAAHQAAALATYPSPAEILGYNPANGTASGVTQAEGGWWLVRTKVPAGQTRTLQASAATLVDDVAVFPWRRNGAPASVSHFAYDRALGLVTSITGANGRTLRYRYDKLGRLMTTYDAYGNPSAATRYHHMNQ